MELAATIGAAAAARWPDPVSSTLNTAPRAAGRALPRAETPADLTLSILTGLGLLPPDRQILPQAVNGALIARQMLHAVAGQASARTRNPY
jgi:hypothetical protein